jgi:hypothetical protein
MMAGASCRSTPDQGWGGGAVHAGHHVLQAALLDCSLVFTLAVSHHDAEVALDDPVQSLHVGGWPVV